MTEHTLKQLICDALRRSKEPDPHVIARRLLARLSQEQRDQVLLHGLMQRVSLEVRMQRSAAGLDGYAPDVEAHNPVVNGSASRVGVSRWQRYQRVTVGGEWKLLADCTADECDLIATDRESGAERLLAVAESFRALAARMRAAGAATVADLDDADVLEAAAA